MTNFEMVETLRDHANVSYEEAKQALEETDWDILEAMVLLEKQGKVNVDGGTYSTRSEPHKEEEKKQSAFKSGMSRLGATLGKLIRKGNENFLEVYRKNEKLFELPVTVAVVLLICFFWVVAILLVVGLFTGFRYAFRGPDLGKPNINDAMNKASDFAENMGKKNDEE